MNQVHNLTVLIAASEQLDTLALTYTLNDFGINNITTSSNQEDDVVRQVLKNDVKTIFLDVLNSELPESKQVVQRLIQRTGCQVIAIGHSTEIFAYRGMLASGASDYLVNPVTPQDLEHVSFAALQLNNEKRNEKIVSIVSAKGGSGSSTIIATLSQQLAELEKRVTCMDLDFSMGDLDLLLNVEGNTALVELLQYPERLEPLVFERSGISVSPEHTLFTGYLPLDTTPFWPQKSAFDQFTKFCLQSSDYLLIDIPTYSLRDQVGFEALKSADIRIIVVEPTLSSIRNAGQIIKRLQNQAASQTIVVLNHCKSDSASLISAHDVKKSLGTSVDVVIPFLPNHFLNKSSLGQPAHKGNRKVKLAFNSLLELVTGEPQQGSRRFWKRGA
ncbi:AAA family ATPase [Vibrio splendidus]|uniref:AAA family ATPase n=1 Tax=Vibrio splendidus TaxID=29497 RepID=UPI000D3BCF74|nr:AAA family ATPase [Vibrio splendidus]PTO58625.1 pilus assembly protein [Vibrio splendidus]PTP00289.1 pilus assembly protein [Vibrio splendidus]PTQ11146.1 pilus assembly protein [Vibrio splendidus]